MNRSVQLSPIADLSPFLGGGELVALDVGPDAQLYAAIALEPLDYRFENPNGGSFAKATPARPQTYRVLAFYEGELTLDLVIAGERFNIHHVQPLPEGELLLAGARSDYHGREGGAPDRNGRVYSAEGHLLREILLGDGIQSVQATSSGVIPLVHLRERRIEEHWAIPVHGSRAFAVWDRLALFAGGYKAREEYHLFDLGREGRIEEVARLTLRDEEGAPLRAEMVIGRGTALYLLRGEQVYRCEVQVAAAA